MFLDHQMVLFWRRYQSNHFALDTLQPGWREIELHPDGRIETRVKRIKQKIFLPNMEEEGY